MSKWSTWYDAQPEHIKKWMENQPVWHDQDLFKFTAIAAVVGFAVGFLFGYEAAWQPVVTVFKPLVG